MAIFKVTLPAGTQYRIEEGETLGDFRTFGEDVEAVVLASFGGITMYQLDNGEAVFVLEEHEIDRSTTSESSPEP